MSRMNFRARHILITGASSGLGRAMALELASRGAVVGLTARREPLLKELVAEIEAAGGKAAYAVVDVVDASSVVQGVELLESRLGPVYGLIANAGIEGMSRHGILDVASADRCIDVNVKGVIHTLAAVQQGLLERKEGFLCTVSSLASYRGLPHAGPYSASKSAVSALMESIRVDWRDSGVCVTTIHPGFVRTPLTAQAKHAQPFIMNADRAARIMIDGLERGRREINYPWQLASIMRMVRKMPPCLYDWVMGRYGS